MCSLQTMQPPLGWNMSTRWVTKGAEESAGAHDGPAWSVATPATLNREAAEPFGAVSLRQGRGRVLSLPLC